MASIISRPNGHKWLQFTGLTGKRQTFRLGKVTPEQARRVRDRLESLLSTRMAGLPIDPEMARWVASLARKHHARLVALGLVDQRQVVTVEELLRDFDATRSVGPSTRQNIQVVLSNLRNFLGESRLLSSIRPADATAFRSWLQSRGGREKNPLAPATVSRRVRRAKQVFKHAVERGWLESNPFRGQAGWNETNRAKDFFVDRETVDAILEEIADAEFRAIVVLARYAGLRCPSEVLPLEWSAVDWDRQTLRVAARKTSTVRFVPLFPEVETALNALWTLAPEWEPRLFPRHQISGSGLTSKLALACRRASLPCWPRPWQNMRATRESELLEAYPIQTVTAWLGHSPKVALTHYAQIAKDHHARAVGANLRKAGKRRERLLRKRPTPKSEAKPEAP